MKFVSVFGPPISQSTPHIYLSALPFAPKMSLVAKHYLMLFPKTLCLKTGKADHWPRTISVFEGHTRQVTSVAFSHDSKRIVSGSYDQTIRVWDAETGEVVVGPLKGHTGVVTSVAFSQDSKRIVSGSYDWTIRVWDAEAGEVVVGPLKEHNDLVSSVAVLQDDQHIVSDPEDHTIYTLSVLNNNLPNLFTDTSTLRGGWIHNSSSELLFWVPSWNRPGLCWPRNHFVIAEGFTSTHLDLDNFVHGDLWQQCKA